MTAAPISAADAKRMVDEAVTFVDARNPVARGDSSQKLPGAIRIPADEVDRHIGELPRSATIVAYCT